jgi:hypothetical protein
MEDDFFMKYLKYKNKYLFLKNRYSNLFTRNQTGGVTVQEFLTYVNQQKTANNETPIIYEPPEPIDPREEQLEQEALNKQLRELDLSPPSSPIESLPRDRYERMQQLFDQAKIQQITGPNLEQTPSDEIEHMTPEEIATLDRQIAELYNNTLYNKLSAPNVSRVRRRDRVEHKLEPIICSSSIYNVDDLERDCRKPDRVGDIFRNLEPSSNTSCLDEAKLKNHICKKAHGSL